jgi:hypothetical protein
MQKDLSPVYDLIRSDGSIVINKALCHAIGLEEALVYSELLSRYNYFNIREDLDEEGYFFNTIDDFQRATTLDAKHQKKAIDNLVKLGLVKTKLKGNPAKRHFYLIDDTSTILEFIKQGKDKVKKLEEKQKEETQKSMQRRKERLEAKRNQQFGENGETSLDIVDKQVSSIQRGNNTNLNNPNLNNTGKDIYITFPSDAHPFFFIFSKWFKKYFKTAHMRLTQRQLSDLEYWINDLEVVGVEEPYFEDGVIEHFESLPQSNNGNMLAFMKASKRYFELTPENYVKNTSKKKSKVKGTFNNFPQRNYDFNKLEAGLLGYEDINMEEV